MEEEITFIVKYEEKEKILTLPEYDTVDDLKSKVHGVFGIPAKHQLIQGWKIEPEFDNTILQTCTEPSSVNFLVIFRKEPPANNENKKDDVQAAVSCFEKIKRECVLSGIQFHTVSLRDAINHSCNTTLPQRRVLLLYLHNGSKPFSRVFLDNLRISRVADTIKKNFYLLGWDVENTTFHKGIAEALNEFQLSHLSTLVRCQLCVMVLIQNIDGCINVSTCVTEENVSQDDFFKALHSVATLLEREKHQEQLLENLEKTTTHKNDMDSIKFQQLMADMLGDRDYDLFEFDQHELLKQKIGFSLFGPPEKAEGYDPKKKILVDEIYGVIKKNSNEAAEYVDQIAISFIYNCTEPLPEQKLERAKKYPDYNPKTDIMPVPIFVLRKCHGSDNPCRLFIDDTGRVYGTWRDYIEENKLHASKMVLPQNGRYQVNERNQVILEYHLSPACGLTARILQVADIVSAGAGLATGAVFLASAFTTITIAPALLMAAGGVGATVGIYAIGRSFYNLLDRSKHKESMSFANSEARGAYINILAGALGFVGAGANMAVSQLAAKGFEIGQGVIIDVKAADLIRYLGITIDKHLRWDEHVNTGAGAVVNTLGVANIGASGVSIMNSGYDVFDQWYNENRKPSLLTIVQLSSSVLFFGNAVYNFKTCSTIVEETQTRTLRDYQDSLRSNRHRKMFTKMMKETVRRSNGNEVRGRAEVISAVRDLPNRDDVFAALTRSNKAMNKNGVKFHASGGDIMMNGQKINMNDFTSMSKRDVGTFLSKLPSKSVISSADVNLMRKQFSFGDLSIPITEQFVQFSVKMLGSYDGNIQKLVITTLTTLYKLFTESINTTLDEIFPNQSKYYNLLNVVLEFFGRKALDLEARYERWRSTRDHGYFESWFEDIVGTEENRYRIFFERAVKMCFEGARLIEDCLRELLSDFNIWLTKQIYEFRMDAESAQRRRDHSSAGPRRIRINCNKCRGYFYQSR